MVNNIDISISKEGFWIRPNNPEFSCDLSEFTGQWALHLPFRGPTKSVWGLLLDQTASHD